MTERVEADTGPAWWTASRPIGSTIRLPRIGVGTAPLGLLYAEVSEEDASATLQAALDLGLSYFDTAPGYGLGRAEERLGRALRGSAAPVIVSSKVGRRIVQIADAEDPSGTRSEIVDAWSSRGVAAALAESLVRLGRDRLDIVLVHDPENNEQDVYEQTWPALERLREQGAVGAIGFGMRDPAMATRLVSRLDVDVVMLANCYNLLDTSAETHFLPACEANSVAVICAGVLGTGLLADPASVDTRYRYRPVPKETRQRALAMQRVCTDFGVPLLAAALRFPLQNPAVATVVLGMRSGQEVRANLAALDVIVPDDLWVALAKIQES